MKFLMHSAALAAALTLAACGGGESQTNDTAAGENAAMDNMMATDPAMMNGTMDANAMMDANMMGGNATMDANTHNAMMKDATTNDADTNLANGM